MISKRIALPLLLWASVALQAATIDQITPTTGPVQGGTVVTLKGKDLAKPIGLSPCLFSSCVPSVSVGGKQAEVIEVAADGTSLRFKTPASAGGAYDVTFTFRMKISFGGETVLGPPIDGGVTVADAFSYGSGDYARVLVPIYAQGEVPGAFGSRWVTELVGWNPSPFAVGVYQVPPATVGGYLDDPEWGKGQSSFRPVLTGPGTAFLYVHGNDPLPFHLRVRDITRQNESWGTEIPVVPESKAFVGRTISLNNIPNDLEARAMLRIYDFDGPTGGRVMVHIHFDDGNPTEQFLIYVFDLPGGAFVEYPGFPGFLQVDLTSTLASAPEAQGAKTLRVSVRSIDGDKRLWAFVSVTNNRTQQITTVTPQH